MNDLAKVMVSNWQEVPLSCDRLCHNILIIYSNVFTRLPANKYYFQIQDFPDKLNFYVMGNVSFFKSMWPEIKGNAAMFLGEYLCITPHKIYLLCLST